MSEKQHMGIGISAAHGFGNPQRGGAKGGHCAFFTPRSFGSRMVICLCIYSLSSFYYFCCLVSWEYPGMLEVGMESSLNGGGWGAGNTHGRAEKRLLSTWVVSCLEDQLKAAWQEVSISGH